MSSPVTRSVAILTWLLFVSCAAISPKVRTSSETGLKGFDLVYFTFGDAWSTHHTMTEVLAQEFERRQFVVLLKEPEAALWPRTLRLRLDLVDDARPRGGKGRPNCVGRLGFRLEQMVDSLEVGRVIYQGISLDRIGQRELAQEIVKQLLKGA
jgi:hypothetical protein